MMTSRRVLIAALAFVASAASIASVAVSADTADQQVVDLPCSMLPHGCKPGTQVESTVEAGGSEESAYCASQLGACIKKCNFDSRCTGQCMFADFECQKKSPASLSASVVTYPLLSSSAASVGVGVGAALNSCASSCASQFGGSSVCWNEGCEPSDSVCQMMCEMLNECVNSCNATPTNNNNNDDNGDINIKIKASVMVPIKMGPKPTAVDESESPCAAQCDQQYVQCQSQCQPFDCPQICAKDYNNCITACPKVKFTQPMVMMKMMKKEKKEKKEVDLPCSMLPHGCKPVNDGAESSSSSSVGESWCEQQCNNAPNAAQCMARCRRIAVGISSSASESSESSKLTIVYNCAWARAEMTRCEKAYNAQPSSSNADDEYEACIRVPSATIQNDPKCTFPALASNSKVTVASSSSDSSSVSDPLTGVRECVKECAKKGKDASNACKHEKFAKRAQCYAQVPNTVKACEAGCNRKPHGVTAAVTTPIRDHPITPSECIWNCGVALNTCLKNVEDWCAPTVWGASCRGNGQLQCKMDNNGCQSACQLAPFVGVTSVPDEVETDNRRPLLGDCQPCDAIYDQCLPACNGMSNCQLACMQNHFNCRMNTPGC